MIFKNITLIILLSLLVISCATKPIASSVEIAQTELAVSMPNDEATKLAIIAELDSKIKRYDTYSGRVFVSVSDGIENISFSGFLKKSNDNSIDLVVLGVFNMVMAEISYKNGELQASSRGDNITLNINSVITSDEIEDLLNYMNSAYIIPDDTYSFYFVRDFRVFYKDNLDIYTDNTPAIIAYYEPYRTVEYVLDILGRPIEILIKRDMRTVRVKFITPTSWIDSSKILSE